MSTIKSDKQGIHVELSVFVYLDKNHPDKDVWIAYCPELDLVGCDHGKEAAKKSFEFVLQEYLDYTLQNNTLERDLIAHGWKKYKNGKLVEPTYKAMVRQGRLDNVATLQNYSKYSLPMTI